MLDQVKVNGVQYRLQTRRCGKPGCKCNNPGQEHGPYWYSYDGNSAAKYVGIHLPEHVTKHVQLLKANGSKIKVLKAKSQEKRDKAQDIVDQANRELTALRNLEAGEYTASAVLKSLGLDQFNGAGGKHAA